MSSGTFFLPIPIGSPPPLLLLLLLLLQLPIYTRFTALKENKNRKSMRTGNGKGDSINGSIISY